MNFQGAAKRLDDIDLPKLGYILGVGEDELHAFIDVETRGTGFDDQGRPRILFERHIFWRELPKSKRAAAQKAGLADPKPGGYGKESEQYGKLLRAMAIDARAALRACSWGLGQVMGFNHKLAGYPTVEEMVEAFKADEENHLLASVTFILNTKLDGALREHNWAAFAKGYNGPAYKINNYDVKLRDAFAKWQRIKDTPWEKEVVVEKPVQPDLVVLEPGDGKEVVPAPPPKSNKNIWATIGGFIIAAIAAAAKYFGG